MVAIGSLVPISTLTKSLIDIILGWNNRNLKNKEDRFREFFEKTFHSMSEIHNNYINMLRECENMLPIYLTSIGTIPPGWRHLEAGNIPPEDVPFLIIKVKNK